MGLEVSKNISTPAELAKTMKACFKRDPGWIRFHAERLADLTEETADASLDLALASLELRAFRLLRERQYEKVINEILSFIEKNGDLDKHTQGWLYQLAARGASLNGQRVLSVDLQKEAFYRNKNLFRPPVDITYERVTLPGNQSEAIADYLNKFKYPRAAFDELESLQSKLVATASAGHSKTLSKNSETCLVSQLKGRNSVWQRS